MLHEYYSYILFIEWEARNVAWGSVLSSQHDHLWPSKGANWRFIPMDVWNGYKNIGENPISKINREGKNKNMTRRCCWSVCWCNPGHPSCWFCCKNKNVTQKSHNLSRWCNVHTCNNLLADQKIWSGRGAGRKMYYVGHHLADFAGKHKQYAQLHNY